jgi:hypothetical protein
MAMKSSSSPANASAANEGSKNSGTGTHTGGSTESPSSGNTTSSTNTTAAAPAFTPFEQWSFTDPNKKMFGVSLGNWLVLERWMNEDWMIQQGGDNAVDEWTLTQILGNKAQDVLSAHWDSWVTEAELDKLQAVGINYIRIPVGYWVSVRWRAVLCAGVLTRCAGLHSRRQRRAVPGDGGPEGADGQGARLDVDARHVRHDRPARHARLAERRPVVRPHHRHDQLVQQLQPGPLGPDRRRRHCVDQPEQVQVAHLVGRRRQRAAAERQQRPSRNPDGEQRDAAPVRGLG